MCSAAAVGAQAPALGDVVLPRNAALSRQGSGRVPFAFSPQCGCAAKELAVVQMREVRSLGGSRGMNFPCHLQSVFTSHSLLVPRARPSQESCAPC